MYRLYEKLPDAVEVDGSFYKVITDFREWLKLIDMINDTSEPMQYKNESFRFWYVDDAPSSYDAQIRGLADFVSMKGFMYEKPKHIDESKEHSHDQYASLGGEKKIEKIEEVQSCKAVIDYNIDAPLIFSAFKQVYNIDLSNQKELDENQLHWYAFRMLIDGLPDKVLLKERMNYRSININSIKDKDERKRIQKIQKQIALPQNQPNDSDIGNAFGSFM